MVGAMAGRAMTMPPAVVTWQEPVERGQRVVIRAGAELEDDQAGRRVRDVHRQQSVPSPGMLGDEPAARIRQVGEPALGPGPDLEPQRLYGKMLRSASRNRPRPPLAGADS